MDEVLRIYEWYGTELPWKKIQRCLAVLAGVILLGACVEWGGARYRMPVRDPGGSAGSAHVEVFSEYAPDLAYLFREDVVLSFPEGKAWLSGLASSFEQAPERKPGAPPGGEDVQNPRVSQVPAASSVIEKPDAGMAADYGVDGSRSLAAGDGIGDVNDGEGAGKAMGSAINREDAAGAMDGIFAKSITVSAYGNGGLPEVAQSTVGAAGFTPDVLEIPKRPGKVFAGWYLEPECLTPFAGIPEGADSLALYAGWSEFPGFLSNDLGHITGCTGGTEAVLEGFLCIPDHESCTGIERGAFDGMEEEILEIYIPAGVTYIEDGVFDRLGRLMYIEVSGENPAYYSEKGILYYRDGGEAAYPRGRALLENAPEE